MEKLIWPKWLLLKGEGAGIIRDGPAAALSLAERLRDPCCLIGTSALLAKLRLPAGETEWQRQAVPTTCSLLYPDRLAEVAQRIPDLIMEEMESWCLFNDNNKPHDKLHSRLRFFKSWAGKVAFRMTLSWIQTYFLNSWFLTVAAVLQACFSPKTQQSHFLTPSIILQAHTAVINMVIIINRRVVLFVFLPQIQKQWKGACLMSEGRFADLWQL